MGVLCSLSCRATVWSDPDAAESHVSRARSTLSTGKLRSGPAHHGRPEYHWNKSRGLAQPATHLHDANCGCRRRTLRELIDGSFCENAGAACFFTGESGGVAVLERHYRASQGRHALALQPGGKYLSVAGTERGQTERG